MPLGVDPKVDYAFKYVFGRDETIPLLIHLLDAVLDLGPAERIVQLQILNPFNVQETETDKLSILDIKVCDQRGRQYNIEMQMFAPAIFPNRALYYWAKLYWQQLHEGQDFTELRPTISICFVNSRLFPQVEDYHLAFRLREPVHGLLFTDHLEAHIIELPKFRRPLEELADPLDRWLFFLRHAEDLEVEPLPAPLDTPEIREAMQQLKHLTEDDIAREAYESRLKEKRDIATLRKLEREEGRQEGRREGLERGELIGRIRFCQEELGRETTPSEDLLAMPEEELKRLADQLRQELSSRRSTG